MIEQFTSLIKESTKSQSILGSTIVQELWGGYGKILRIKLENPEINSVIVKHVQFPKIKNHKYGWNSQLGHLRKIKSYQVETRWYKDYSMLSKAKLPYCYALQSTENEVVMVLEDLNLSGFNLRKSSLNWEEISLCLQWLARFHATYLDVIPAGLWDVGTYWHLETRPEELSAISDKTIREAAPYIDTKLNKATYKTIVHGDAKVANFCFDPNGYVSGVDFQYVGGGCGMKDVAYFIGSCLYEDDCEKMEESILDTYFYHLKTALSKENEALEKEWRALYRVAWADFHRFLKGWSPGHWKINGYSERVLKEVIANL